MWKNLKMNSLEIQEGPKRKGQGQFAKEAIKNMDEAYTIAEEKTFSVGRYDNKKK